MPVKLLFSPRTLSVFVWVYGWVYSYKHTISERGDRDRTRFERSRSRAESLYAIDLHWIDEHDRESSPCLRSLRALAAVNRKILKSIEFTSQLHKVMSGKDRSFHIGNTSVSLTFQVGNTSALVFIRFGDPVRAH